MKYRITTEDEIIYSEECTKLNGGMTYDVEAIWNPKSEAIYFIDEYNNITIIPKKEVKKIEIL